MSTDGLEIKIDPERGVKTGQVTSKSRPQDDREVWGLKDFNTTIKKGRVWPTRQVESIKTVVILVKGQWSYVLVSN